MAVSLSIKDVPDSLARALRARAAQHHRSLQGELMIILEEAFQPKPFRAKELLMELQKLNFTTPNESTKWIREDRDNR